MKYRLIASDFDNTLYDEVALSPRALKAIADYRAAGGKFCIATGRIFTAIRPFIQEVGADDEVIACLKNYNYVLVYSCKLFNKFILNLWHIKSCTVSPFCFITFRETCENNYSISFACCSNCFISEGCCCSYKVFVIPLIFL